MGTARLNSLQKKFRRDEVLTAAAEAGSSRAIIATLKRCTTQRQKQKPHASYRSGKPLRHPNIGCQSDFFRKL
jgi:hypothetical protein